MSTPRPADEALLRYGVALYVNADTLGPMTATEVAGYAKRIMRTATGSVDIDDLVSHRGDDVHQVAADTLTHLARSGFTDDRWHGELDNQKDPTP